MRIAGHVVIGAGCAPFHAARVRVVAEDTSRLDAAAVRLAETEVAAGPHAAGRETRVPFSLEVPDAPPATLRAHVSPAGTRAVQRGDKVSTEAIRADPARPVEIRVADVA